MVLGVFVLKFGILTFDIVSNFVFRASDFNRKLCFSGLSRAVVLGTRRIKA